MYTHVLVATFKHIKANNAKSSDNTFSALDFTLKYEVTPLLLGDDPNLREHFYVSIKIGST